MGLYLGAASIENLSITIINDVDISVVKKFLMSSDFKKIKQLLGTETRFHCWAMTHKKPFNEMSKGDLMLLAENGTGLFKYAGEVFFTAVSEELGSFLWPYKSGNPWKNIYFLRDIHEIKIGKRILIKDLGYNSNFLLQTTIRVQKNLVDNILNRYESIYSWINALGGENDAVYK